MVEDAKSQLRKEMVMLKDEFLMTGFSASRTFTNRFSLRHPPKLKATAYGGINAIAMLPLAALNGNKLGYPIGTADIKALRVRK